MRGIRICASLLLSLFFFNEVTVKAQTQKQDSFCQPNIEEILYTINPVKDWNPAFDEILVGGEIRTSAIFKSPDEPLSLSKAIAMLGGLLKTAQQPIYLIRSSADKNRSKIDVDFNKIRKGESEDVSLKKGDIVFVSRGCANGKLLPTTKPTMPFPQREPRGVDAPIKFRMPIY